MAISKCGSCNWNYFEAKEISPSGSNFKMIAVQCSGCGAVVGVSDYYNIGTVLRAVAAKLGINPDSL